MSAEDMAEYKEMKADEEIHIQRVLKEIDEYDVYENFNGVNVVDTDYDNFMITYSCFEFKDEDDYLPINEQNHKYIMKMSENTKFIDFQKNLRDNKKADVEIMRAIDPESF